MNPDMRALLEPKKKPKGNSLQHRSRNNDSSPKTPTSPTTLRNYDPRALLNPRGSKTMPSNSKLLAKSENVQESGLDDPKSSQRGGFSLLEHVHGAEQRTDSRPSKRVKTNPQDEQSDSDKKSKPISTSRHGNAGMGTYFKKDESKLDALPPGLVDLTVDDDEDDDDEFQITGVRNLKNEEEVCFGMLDAKILAYKVPKPIKATPSHFALNNQWPVIKCDLVRNRGRGDTIECKDPHGVAFGNIEDIVASALAPVMDDFMKLRTQARLISRPKREGEWAHQGCSERIKVVVNLYGRRGDGQKLGKFLGHKNTWLRPPLLSDQGVPIENPHATSKAQAAKIANKIAATSTRTVEEATEAVSRLFDQLGSEVNIELPETDGPSNIITTLLSHQKQALTFMLQRERGRTYESLDSENTSLWRKKVDRRGRTVYEELVTGLQVLNEPEQVFGGLLADVMGLGKTIEALALLGATLDQAKTFAKQQITRRQDNENSLITNSRATLIIAPLSTVKNWEDQIQEHVQRDAMRYYVYHGSSREKDAFKLADYDIVISTYGTISADFSNKNSLSISPIKQICWFRIILDEAHTIREPKSSQAQAIYSISAQRRWCLTGTPIQNRMEDLASLTRFLRLFPYDTIARFNQYVRGPAQSGDPNFLKSLRVFVDSFTLRRLRDCIDLPKKTDLIIKLSFSPEERRIHDHFREKFSVTIQRMAKDAAKGRTRGGEYHRVLEGIMILRLICAHGKELLKEAQLEDLKGMSAAEPLDVDEERVPRAISTRKAYEHFSMMAEADIDLCAQCGKKISGDSPSAEMEGSESSRAYVLSCFDILCSECFSDLKSDFDEQRQRGSSTYCPLEHCSRAINPFYVPISKSVAEALETLPEDSLGEDLTNFKRGQYSGPHTKTRELVAEIHDMQQESKLLMRNGEAPLKCVVFSEFTSHLDLIERALGDNGMTFVRIDGSMSLAKRRKVLDELNTNNEVTILLASIKAAGQGLNLTAASRAFIMEPMWNPAAEAQAVDRIYRIGQKREVVVKRFQMADSMEDKIVALQKKKQQMADLSMNRGEIHSKLSKKVRSEESWKAMVDVFKS